MFFKNTASVTMVNPIMQVKTDKKNLKTFTIHLLLANNPKMMMMLMLKYF